MPVFNLNSAIPIRLGDTIKLNKQLGLVKEIGFRACKLNSDDGSDLIVPNGDILSKNITIWTLSGRSRRMEFNLFTKLENNSDRTMQTIESVLEKSELVMKTPKPQIFLHSMDNGALHYQCHCWCDNVKNIDSTKSVILISISREFKSKGIAIANNKINLEIEKDLSVSPMGKK